MRKLAHLALVALLLAPVPARAAWLTISNESEVAAMVAAEGGFILLLRCTTVRGHTVSLGLETAMDAPWLLDDEGVTFAIGSKTFGPIPTHFANSGHVADAVPAMVEALASGRTVDVSFMWDNGDTETVSFPLTNSRDMIEAMVCAN